MSHFFLDSSAVVKLYVNEIGSGWLRGLVDPPTGRQVILAEITLAEVSAALARRARMPIGGITVQERDQCLYDFLHDCDTRFSLVAVDRFGVNHAVVLAQVHRLRGYDAVQLATALTASSLLVQAGFAQPAFVAADDDLLAAAGAEGLLTENPNHHP